MLRQERAFWRSNFKCWLYAPPQEEQAGGGKSAKRALPNTTRAEHVTGATPLGAFRFSILATTNNQGRPRARPLVYHHLAATSHLACLLSGAFLVQH